VFVSSDGNLEKLALTKRKLIQANKSKSFVFKKFHATSPSSHFL